MQSLVIVDISPLELCVQKVKSSLTTSNQSHSASYMR